MRKFIAVFIILSLAAAISGCGLSASGRPPSPGRTAEKYSDSILDAFDTVITVTAYCESQKDFDRLMDTAHDEFLRYHRLFDIYFTYPGMNNLCTVNGSAGIAPVEVGQEIIDLLLLSRQIFELTGGRTNVAMGSVLSLWHAVREHNSGVPESEAILPDADKLREAAGHCSIDSVVIDADARTVYLADPEMSLDVGAVAKGFAAERVAQTLGEMGYEHFVINAGGNVRCFGTKPGGENWNVAVTNPGLSGFGGTIGVVSVPGGSVVTSGSYQRYFTYEGRCYHHIIDPDTLMPENRYLSVTVLAEDSGLADALSTALFNMDPEDALPFVDSLDGVEAMWVLSDGTQKFSANFRMSE